jgi:hypothetical protein
MMWRSGHGWRREKVDGHEWKRSERIRSAWRVKELLAGSQSRKSGSGCRKFILGSIERDMKCCLKKCGSEKGRRCEGGYLEGSRGGRKSAQKGVDKIICRSQYCIFQGLSNEIFYLWFFFFRRLPLGSLRITPLIIFIYDFESARYSNLAQRSQLSTPPLIKTIS